ncbi:THO complex subunit 3, partial [Plectosphaerella cucumerina]
MAPLRARISLSKDKFPPYFSTVKIQSYQESTVVRGAAPRSLNSIAWNPTGTLIATGSSDKTLRVWNPEKPNVRFSTELKGHSGPIEKVAFNPVKDAELCSLSSDGMARFWDARGKTCTNEVRDLGEANTLAWAPNGETLVVGNKAGTIFILSPSQPSPLSSHQQPGCINQIVFCWGGEKVFLATGDGRVRILSYPNLEPLLLHHDEEGGDATEFSLKGHTSSCISIDIQPTARYLASGGDDNVIALWDTTDWICHKTMTKVNGPVRSISEQNRFSN